MGDLFLSLAGAGLKRATGLGVLGGVLLILLFRVPGVGPGVSVGSARFIWFAVATVVLTVLFARGVELTRTGALVTRRAIDEELVVDLLHIERLYGWGRAAARNSLTWFAVSASACLLFMSQVSPLVSAGLLGACALMGLWAFVSTTHRIHRRIHAAKTDELDTLRTEISDLRTRPGDEPQSSVKLHSLLAYETRIAAVREWPFDQSILARVLGSTLILTLPWFGQAVAGVLVEHARPFSSGEPETRLSVSIKALEAPPPALPRGSGTQAFFVADSEPPRLGQAPRNTKKTWVLSRGDDQYKSAGCTSPETN